MALPDSFSSWEHLQTVLMSVYNRTVREEFADLGEDWEPEIGTPRGSLRTACTIRDDDSLPQSLMRMMLFYFSLRKAADLQAPIYGVPVTSYQESRKFHPQIQLYFQEDVNDVEQGYSPVTGELSFRLMQESAETLTEVELQTYANRIRSNFAAAGGFVWRKGKLMAAYTDRRRGYQLQLLVRSEAEARRLVEQVLDLQGHTPDWKFLNLSENVEAAARYPTVPPTERILGRSRRMPRQRPIADVRFIYALCHVHGLPNPVVLVDRSRLFRQPLTTAP